MKKILLFLLLTLTACGFRPMYSGDDMSIYVSPIDGINGIELRNALNTQFGGPHDETAKYKLVVSLDEPLIQYKALAQTGDTTWQEISIKANYKILYDNKEIASGTERASESYTFVRYLVASNASYNNAVKNTISVLAKKIGARVISQTQKAE